MLPAGRVLAHKACRFAPRRQCNGPRQRRVARIASGYRCETARNLPGISQRSGQEPQMIAAWRWVDPTAAIKGAERRLHSDNPANRCRPQYRSAYLAAGRQRQHMGRDRSRRAGRRPPGRPFEVPWIPGGTRKGHRELGSDGLADDHRAAAAQGIDVRGVHLGLIVHEEPTVTSGWKASDVEAILDDSNSEMLIPEIALNCL